MMGHTVAFILISWLVGSLYIEGLKAFTDLYLLITGRIK